MNPGSRLTYANVVATLALVLAIGGGTVYAAIELGKNDVKSKNIAKGAVKNPDLAKEAVTGVKVKDATITGAEVQDGTLTAEDIAAGVIPQIQADVTGSATAGAQGGINTATTAPVPLSGTTSFTPSAGEVAAVAAEAQFTYATTNAANPCSPALGLLVNGEETRVFVGPGSTNSTTPIQGVGNDADGPFGLLSPGTPINVTAVLTGDADCTAASQLDRLEVRIVQLR
jgi:hypothetical protein